MIKFISNENGQISGSVVVTLSDRYDFALIEFASSIFMKCDKNERGEVRKGIRESRRR